MADLIPSPAGASALSLPRPIGTANPLERLRSFAGQPAIAKSLPMMGLLGIVGAAALAWSALSSPPQRDLFDGLADTDKAAVASALDSAAIPYALDRGTGTLSVGEQDFHRARMLLASQGLPKSAPDGDAMISSLPMGASRAVEGERLRGAREMDLARTIEAIDAVQTARIHLAVEAPSVFLREEGRAAASVMLKLRAGRALSPAQVGAIAHLVASSVPGLTPDAVSIVDQAGRLLSSGDGGGDSGTDASDKQVAIQQRIENRYVEAVSRILAPIVGADAFTTQVHADLDFAEVQATRETFPAEGRVVRAEQGGWTKEGGPGGEPSGIPGALSNTAPPATQVQATPPAADAAAATGEAPAERTSETYNRTFDVGREISVTKNPVGTVRRLSVAVALKQPEGGKPRTPAEIAALEALVKGAVGYDEKRGDLIAVSARNFAVVDNSATAPNWYEAPWVALLARNLSALVVAGLLIFGLGKPLMKSRAKASETRIAQRQTNRAALGHEMAGALADNARGDPGRPITLDMIEAAPGYAARADLIRNFVRQDPSRAALVVRDLIRADMAPAEARNG